jgi:hypothetical protein
MESTETLIFQDGSMLNPGLNALWEDEKKRRELNNLSTDIEPLESQGFQLYK